MHFQANDDVENPHIADDGERTDLFQTIVRNGSAWRTFPEYPEPEPGSDKALTRARHFVEEWTDEHDGSIDHAFMPNRVITIEVSKTDTHTHVKLVSKGDVPDGSAYAALSYCWGGDQKLKLTSKTYDLLGHSFASEDLPKTLQDAVIVAAKFSIFYLWVDALCIVQDDDTDKGRELAVMAQIYENASLVISASRASSVDEGFLQPRLPFKRNASMSFGLWLVTPAGDERNPSLCFLATDLVGFQPPHVKVSESLHDGVPRDPLISRAWCLQERGLAKRLVEFGRLSTRIRIIRPGLPDVLYADGCTTDELHNIPFSSCCVQAILSEQEPTNSSLIEDLRTSKGHRIFEESNLPRGMKGIQIYWCSTLTYYSGLSLSFPSDRLPAFSALASTFAPAFGGEYNYLAGIWRQTLPVGLLWVVHSGEQDSRDGLLRGGIAPSWSWASNSRQVSYLLNDPARGSFHDNLLVSDLALDQGLEVLDCKIELTNEAAAFGAVKRGELKLRGRLLPVRVSLEKHSTPWNDVGDFATRMEAATSYIRVEGDFINERGMHRRSYEHPEPSFQERRLMAEIYLDHNEAAFESTVAEANGQLFALPIASRPSERKEKGLNERLWNMETPDIPTIYGIMVLLQNDGTYVRLGVYKFTNQDTEWLFDDARLEMDRMLDLVDDQYRWMLSGEVTELILV